MVGPLNNAVRHNDIPVVAPSGDAGHNAHKIKSARVTINGRETEFIVQPFSDRIFVIVTQMKKMGTMVCFH